jgi:6-phosphofructokinase
VVVVVVVLLQVEASSARQGIGLVKLMGRQSGFIAMQASMASGGAGGQAYGWKEQAALTA